MVIWADSMESETYIRTFSGNPFRWEEMGRKEEAEGPGEGRGHRKGAQTVEAPRTQDAARSSVTLITATCHSSHRVWHTGGTRIDVFLPTCSFRTLSAGCSLIESGFEHLLYA